MLVCCPKLSKGYHIIFLSLSLFRVTHTSAQTLIHAHIPTSLSTCQFSNQHHLAVDLILASLTPSLLFLRPIELTDLAFMEVDIYGFSEPARKYTSISVFFIAYSSDVVVNDVCG